MKNAGYVLVILGVAALIAGGIGFNRQTTVLDVGGIKATATEHQSMPFVTVVGTIALVGGIALLVVPGVRRT
jgi:hypothetical protein